MNPASAQPSVADRFEALGRRIDRAWRAHQYDETIFATLAEEILAEANLAAHVTPGALFAHAATCERLPPQLDPTGGFGEPPLTLYFGERFVIDVYTWFSSTTSIHQHAFSGAFYVLEGGSVHARYAFQEDKRINAHLRLGKVLFQSVELLSRGQVRAIQPGAPFIHALFHLQHPSLTVVVRTKDDPGFSPQFSYVPPHVAYDPFYALQKRRLEVFGALARISPAAYEQAAAQRIGETDLFGAFLLLRQALGHLQSERPRFEALCEVAERVHGADALPVITSLREARRMQQVSDLRRDVIDPDFRFFLALLLNVPTGAEIRRLVEERFPEGAAADHITRWVASLADEGRVGFRLDEIQRDVLRLSVAGLRQDALVDALKNTYDPDTVEAARGRIEVVSAQLRAQPFLSPLFA